ncbi:MAG: hypothetical protein ABIO45_15890 [Burkholderiaceae bacterium]
MTAVLPSPTVVEPTPVERLALSREQIRESIAGVGLPSRRVDRAELGAASTSLQSLFDKAVKLPGVNAIVDAAQSWWRYHPWRAVGAVAADAGRLAVAPVANRHPVALVLGAALVGALLLRWGPWRWVAKRTLIAGFVPSLAIGIAASVPTESWFSALASLRGKPETRKPPPARPPI